MDVTPLVKKGQQIIQGYTGGVFKISGKSWPGPVLVFPDYTEIWDLDGETALERLEIGHFEPLLQKKGEIDVILLGCGPQMKFLPPALKSPLKTVGLHVEIMDTGAACRTYNVLMAEGRRVAAALLPA